MKNLYFLSFLFIFTISCQKEEAPNTEIPDWLLPRIESLENSEQHCWSCRITRYKYNNAYYYNVYCGYWSCAFCELYNNDGILTSEVDNFNFEDFLSAKKEETIIWDCTKPD